MASPFWFCSALNISLFPPTFSCAFSPVFLPTVFHGWAFYRSSITGSYQLWWTEDKGAGPMQGSYVAHGEASSLMRVDARAGQRLEADSGEGESDSLSLPLGTPPLLPPPFHLLTLHVNTSGKLSFKILERISLSKVAGPSPLPGHLSRHSQLPPTHSNRVKPGQLFNIICGLFLIYFLHHYIFEFNDFTTM